MPRSGGKSLPEPGGKTASKYHHARFTLASELREELAALVPAGRGRGRP